MTATEILGYLLSGDYFGLLLAVLVDIFRALSAFGV